MRRSMLAAVAALWLMGVVPRESAAQQWNDERTLALVRQAVERRARELADSGLVDYHAQAHGYLTFLAQVGEGFREPPRVVKADELALEVYWRAPNLSKQRIMGQRDTLLLPTDISYHRDHLGIVQNNFPDIIRIGEGDEVLDVPHPLSPTGLTNYDFSVGDSLRITYPGRSITVDIVRVRPKNDALPRLVGAVFVERETAQVVRMAFSFTRAALRDKALEDISVVLESSLVEGRFWLPSRQEVEIRRTGTWMEYPVRGIIRGRWEICCYEVNKGIPASFFGGPEIVLGKPRDRLREGFSGRILDSLPSDVRAVTDEDVKRVQEEARALVRQQALTRARGGAVALHGISDIVRVNRVEGLAVGASLAAHLGQGVTTTVAGRYGVDDRRAKGRANLRWRRASGSGFDILAQDDFRELGDEAEVSLVRNSIAAQEFGSDYTDPYAVRAVGARLVWARGSGLVWTLGATLERQRALMVHAAPASGRYEPTVPVRDRRGPRLTLTVERPTVAVLGFDVRGGGELRWSSMRGRDGATAVERRARVLRAAGQLTAERPLGRKTLLLRTTAAAAGSRDPMPVQELVFLGGPTSGPGYDFHRLVGRAGAAQHVELQLPVPFVAVPLGRFGTAPGEARLAPFAHAVYVDRPLVAPSGRAGIYPSVGAGFLLPFSVLRFDIARGLRDGRWTFSVDVAREFWSVL
ncbi:MAG TPA: hypothetical protein VHM30_10290 [Gemmatimonadaceae bacterium]|nr:hypothetical protein [Gemmatimonadaceae bacterium]